MAGKNGLGKSSRAATQKFKFRTVTLSALEVMRVDDGDWEAAIRPRFIDFQKLSNEAAKLICTLRPVVITKQNKDSYAIVAGVRTFQVLREKFPGSFKFTALELLGPTQEYCKLMRAFDAMLSPVFDALTEDSLILIARKFVENKTAKEYLAQWLGISKVAEVSNLIGIRTSTLFRKFAEIKQDTSANQENKLQQGTVFITSLKNSDD